jgi:hypothetical protein
MIDVNSTPNDDGPPRWIVIDRSADNITYTLLTSVFGHRIDGELIGCVITNTRANAYWDTLECSDRLSSSERAIACLARGCFMIEQHGVRADHGRLVVESIAALTSPIGARITPEGPESRSGARTCPSGDAP